MAFQEADLGDIQGVLSDLAQQYERLIPLMEQEVGLRTQQIGALLKTATGAQAEYSRGVRGGPAADFFSSYQAAIGGGAGPGVPSQAGLPLLPLLATGGRAALSYAARYLIPGGAAGIGANAASNWAASAGKGTAFDLREQIPFVGPYVKGLRTQAEAASGTAFYLGMDPKRFLGYTNADPRGGMLGSIRDPLSGIGVGSEVSRKTLENLTPFRQYGGSEEATIGMARKLLERHGNAGPDAAQSLAPFLTDPLTRGIVTRELNRGTANEMNALMGNMAATLGLKPHSQIPTELNSSFARSGVLEHGLPATFNALNALLPEGDPKRQELQTAAYKFADRLRTTGLDISIAESGASIAGSRFARSMTGGADIDDPGVRQAKQAEIKATQSYVQELENRTRLLRESGSLSKVEQKALGEWTRQLETARTTLAQMVQADRSAVAARQVERIGVQTTLHSLAAGREAYGMNPGQVPTSLGLQRSGMNALIAKNEEIAADPTRPPQEREAARIAASQTRTGMIALNRSEDYHRFGQSRLVTEGFTGRAVERLQFRMEGGAGLGELNPLLSESIRGAESALTKGRHELAWRQAHRDRYSVEDIEQSRAGVFGAEQRVNSLRKVEAYLPGEFHLNDLSREGMVLSARTGYSRMLGLGPAADRAGVMATAGLMNRRREALLSQAAVADQEKDTERAADLRTQAETVGFAASAATLEGLSTFSLSAPERIRMGKSDLQMSLAQMDPYHMGMGEGFHRQRIGMFNSALGQLQTQIESASPEMRAAVEANLMPQFQSLHTSRMQSIVDLRHGERKSMMSYMYGAPSGSAMYSTPIASLQEYGRSTGTPIPTAFGGSGVNGPDMLTMTGSSGAVSLSPESAAGGVMSGNMMPVEMRQLVQVNETQASLLADIKNLLANNSGNTSITPASGPPLRQQEANSPQAAQRALTFGVR